MEKTANTRFISQSNKQAFRNPWVLGWLALLLTVLAVNAGMIATAFITNPGLVEEDYYEKGRDHERNFQKRMAARSALGWELAIEAPRKLVQDRSGVFRLQALDKDGQPLSGADVSVIAYRPSDASADFRFDLKEVVPGQYDGFAAFPLKGIWDLKVAVHRGDDQYDFERRISVTAQ